MKCNIYLYIYLFVCLFDWSQLKESIRIKKKHDESDEEDDEDDDDGEESYDEDEEDNEQVSSKDGTHATHAGKIPWYMDRWSPRLFTWENNMLIAVLRALAFYQCELGSALYLTPFVGWVCWFSTLPWEVTCTTVFPGYYGFPPGTTGFFPGYYGFPSQTHRCWGCKYFCNLVLCFVGSEVSRLNSLNFST